MKQEINELIKESHLYLSKIQDSFKKKYNLNYYENWYYEDGTAIFKFNTGEDEMYFKYQIVGSFSKNTNTWKWSWDNEHLPKIVKKDLSKVKEYGESNLYEKLTTGMWEADEIDGWEMTAIASKILKPIGAYRIPSEHLLTYCLLTEPITKEDVIEIEEFYIDCGSHGKRRRTFVCKHLNKEGKTGFHEAFPSDENEILPIGDDYDYQAWCNKCEAVRLKNDGWNDVSMEYASIKIICSNCYFDIKRLNT